MLARRTARFGELAVRIEDRLATLSIEIEPKVVDAILRERIDKVAELMRTTPRSALVTHPMIFLTRRSGHHIGDHGLARTRAPWV